MNDGDRSAMIDFLARPPSSFFGHTLDCSTFAASRPRTLPPPPRSHQCPAFTVWARSVFKDDFYQTAYLRFCSHASPLRVWGDVYLRRASWSVHRETNTAPHKPDGYTRMTARGAVSDERFECETAAIMQRTLNGFNGWGRGIL